MADPTGLEVYPIWSTVKLAREAARASLGSSS